MRARIVLFVLSVLAVPHFLVAGLAESDKLNLPQGYTYYVDGLGYDTVQPIVDVEADQFKNLEHLNEIVIAIARYENERFSFPHSGDTGIQMMSAAGSGKEWIHGLVPQYIDKLPQDVKQQNDSKHNFIYYSNGVDYKLLALSPEGCESIKEKYSQMADPKRGCRAYGYWTEGARAW